MPSKASVRRFVYSRETSLSVKLSLTHTHTRESIMLAIIATEFMVCGITLGTCVVDISFESDDWRKYVLENETGRYPGFKVENVAFQGESVPSCRAGKWRSELDTIANAIECPTSDQSVLKCLGLMGLFDTIDETIRRKLFD